MRGVGAVLLALLVGACTSTHHRAPVEERPNGGRAAAAPLAAAAPADAASRPPPGIENAGKPGYYTVKQGDTLIRIGLDTGQNWRDIARWNNLDNPNVIEVGQVVRVAPPSIDPTIAAARSVSPARVETRPLDAAKAASAPVPGAASGPAASAVAAVPGASAPPAAAASAVAPPVAQAPRDSVDDDLVWAWPANGPVVTPFDDVRSKGLAITGKAGDPVLAAADGRVVYAGSGLRGYGNLVIVKHNNTYLTAYAHNQTLLVKEEQPVRRGQKIAEMGSSDADRVELHFEIRKQGKPIDPARLLPPR
jgi:lipoprotein NlpD